jgi:hypothetical protein
MTDITQITTGDKAPDQYSPQTVKVIKNKAKQQQKTNKTSQNWHSQKMPKEMW